MTEPFPPQPSRERAINAPWPTLILVAAILGLYALQGWFGRTWPWDFGLIPVDLKDGALLEAVTYMGVHGDWMHAGSNAVGALAFGAPLARRLGESPKGGLTFLLFFLLCGVASGVVYALVNGDSSVPLIGASGGVFGLIGAATRLMNRDGALEPLTSRRVLAMTGAWVGLNVMIGVLGFDPATGVRGIAWEAHLIGLACGLLSVGGWLRLFGAPAPAAPPGGPWGPQH